MISKENTLAEVHRHKLDLEGRLEDWIEQDISILSDEYLVIGRQVPTIYNTFIDILCLDRNGDLVIIELKRDKTPRDTVAQVLDYASWVRDLSRDDVISIANAYLKEKGPIEAAFLQKFQENLPDVLNASHTMLVVASDIDASTDRIVQYLSETHGVGINIAEFQYFKEKNQVEYVSRVFLIDPETASSNVERVGASKRKPNLTREELEEIAKQNGVDEFYSTLVENLRGFFDGSRTTRSSLGFDGKNIEELGRGVIFNLIPPESNQEKGLKFQVYSHRFSHYFKCSIQDLLDILPMNRQDWTYEQSDKGKLWLGYAGFFKTSKEIEVFLEGLREIAANKK
ncbi:MAG TPA: endonuclease NucS [Methanolinea sp.]|nr:endonuclease NucS [Methanolinea sp.]